MTSDSITISKLFKKKVLRYQLKFRLIWIASLGFIIKETGVDKMGNITGYGKATQEAVNNFEQQVGFEIPADYKQFLLEFNGGTTTVQNGKFYVEALDTLVSLDVLYGLDIDNEQLDLQKLHEEHKEGLHTNCIIIGNDTCAGKILLIDNDDEQGIYFWDQGWYADPSSQDENIYKVAESFQSFIEGLKIPEEI